MDPNSRKGPEPMSGDASTAPTGRSDGSGVDRLHEVKQNIDGTIDVMEDNMRKMAMRQEQMDTLLDKSEILGETSDEFRGRSQQLERSMWWKKWQMMIIVAGVCIGLLFVLFVFNRVAFYAGLVAAAAFAGVVVFFFVKKRRSATDPAVLYYGNTPSDDV
eukprot:Selendium_serpulae@DN4923_c0_g1_i1.p1